MLPHPTHDHPQGLSLAACERAALRAGGPSVALYVAQVLSRTVAES
jgi:hypothetical protein